MPLLEDLLSSLGADRWLPGAGAGAAALAAIPAGYWWAVGISAGLAAVALTLRKERAEAITTEEEATQEDAEEEDAGEAQRERCGVMLSFSPCSMPPPPLFSTDDDNGDSVVSEEVKARTMLRAKAAMQKAAIRQRVEDSLTEEERRTEQM